MTLNIKHDEADRLTRELADRTGSTGPSSQPFESDANASDRRRSVEDGVSDVDRERAESRRILHNEEAAQPRHPLGD